MASISTAAKSAQTASQSATGADMAVTTPAPSFDTCLAVETALCANNVDTASTWVVSGGIAAETAVGRPCGFPRSYGDSRLISGNRVQLTVRRRCAPEHLVRMRAHPQLKETMTTMRKVTRRQRNSRRENVIHVGAGFVAKERPHLLETLSTLGPHLGRWHPRDVEVNVSLRDRGG